MSDSINLFESYLEIYEGKPVAAPADEPNRSSKSFGFNEFGEFVRNRKGGEDLPQRPPQKARVVKKSATKKPYVKEDLEYLLDYIVSEGYADTYESAITILESMSDEWLEDILDLSEKWYKDGDPKYKENVHGDKVGGGKDRRTSLTGRLTMFGPFKKSYTQSRTRINDKKIDQYYEGPRKARVIKRSAAGGKSYSEDTSYETVDERVDVTRLGPNPSYKPRSRERDIGKHNDWKDKPLEWDQRSEKALKLKRRAKAVSDTQKREDKEVGLRREDLEYLLDYLVSEGYADTYDSAITILESMSDEWLDDILDLSERTFHGKMPGRAIQTISTLSGNYTSGKNEPDQRDSRTKNSHAEMRERWKDQDRKEKEAKEAAKQKVEKEKRWRNSFRPPSRGVAHDESSIRRRSSLRTSQRTPSYVANMKGRSLDKSDPKQKERFNKIRNALKNKTNWGQKSEELEYLLNYIISEGYADTYDSAIPILESMSDEWLEDILNEVSTPKQQYQNLVSRMKNSKEKKEKKRLKGELNALDTMTSRGGYGGRDDYEMW